MNGSKRRYLDVLLGAFVAAGIVLLATFIFIIGKERRLFDQAAHVEAKFPNVAGLSVGGQVLLGGVVVGHVSEISFPALGAKGAAARDVTVVMRISSQMMPWVRKDSVAQIDSKGLLGDKTINISVGSSDEPQVEDGGFLRSAPPALDFSRALGLMQKVLEDVSDGIGSARKILEGFVKQGGDSALAGAAKSVENIVKEVQNGEGMIHRIIYDKEAGKDLAEVVQNVGATSRKLNALLASIDRITAEIEKGGGLAHALLYDEEGGKVTKQLAQILGDISSFVDKENTPEGHSKIQALFADLQRASSDFATILGRVKDGQGTVGKLLADPSVYEDLKLILGRVRRNEALKALVRFGISQQESSAASNDE